MSYQPDKVPPEILQCIRQGNKIEAIKLLREHSGWGLREAKDEAERLEAGLASGQIPFSASAGAGAGAAEEVPADIAKLARQGKKIEAIKLLRERTGCGLKESKDRIEALPGVPKTAGCMSVMVLVVLLVAAATLLARSF